MTWNPKPAYPVAVRFAAPIALVAALTSPFALQELERLEGNILGVYSDPLVPGTPTYCAGRVDKAAPVGTALLSDDCDEVNKITMLEYGMAVLGCTKWEMLNERRIVALTLFAINVGKDAACGSAAFSAINAGRITAGCNLLAMKPNGEPNWSYSGGKYVEGLQKRRQAERAHCLVGTEKLDIT